MARGLVRIIFELDANDWHSSGSESLWAEPMIRFERSIFQIRNSPFCATGISFLDIIRAMPTENEAVYRFAEVIERSGHSTFMLLLRSDHVHGPTYWKLLKELGCSYESADIDLSIGVRKLYSVDVPPTSDLSDVYDVLERGERADVWMFQEGYVHIPDPPKPS